MLYNHPNTFKSGTRILLLVNRNKDGTSEKLTITRVSHDIETFDKKLLELYNSSNTGSRIYASASSRDLEKAVRRFKHNQLDADYDANPLDFYKNLNARWVHALALSESVDKQTKLWMFDCDTEEEYKECLQVLENFAIIEYKYRTKNGNHILVKPFNKKMLSTNVSRLLHENPMILWSY